MSDFFVFVDESGDLGALGSKYFIVAAVQVVDEKHLGRIIKKARQRILNRKLADVTELKAVKSTPEIRRFVLGKIASLDCKIYVLAVEKKRIAAGLMAVQDRLYNWLCRLLCQQLPPGNLRLIFDKKCSVA